MESKVFSFILALFQKIALWFDNSAVGKLYDKICKACYKAFHESKVGSFFIREPGKSDAFANQKQKAFSKI